MTAVSSQPVRGSRFPTLEKYDVLEELGHGGMATVYRARDLRLGRDVAVKVIHPHLRDSAEAVRRFSIEARAVAKLRHPNIVEVYDVSAPTESEQYLVVELLRGVTLRRLLEKHGAIPPEVAASLGVELLSALGHAHDAGVIHRDVKPENVILEHRGRSILPPPATAPESGEAGELPRPSEASPSGSIPVRSPGPTSVSPGDRITIKLTDFGIAKLLDAQGVTSTGQVMGSPAHMAPEQIEGREVDARADVFGIGVLLYECMVGHLPFQGTNPAQVLRRVLEGEYASAEHEQPTVGRTWSGILDQALAGAMEERFAGAPQLRDALVRELARVGVSSPRAEIEAWLDDPEAFVVAQQATMTTRLCERAASAAARGDVLPAAADYNRALAYSPHDANLLKLVARMNRRSARRDGLRRAWPIALAVVLLAGAGLTVRTVRIRAARELAVQTGAPVLLPLETVGTPVPAAGSSASFPAEIASATRTLAHPTVGPRPSAQPPKPVGRELRFTSVEPQQGVRISIDGAPAGPLDPGKPLVIDEKAHSLVFSCAADLCDTLARAIDPGEHAAPLVVHLTVKQAKLLLRGNPAYHYVLTDDPDRRIEAGDTPISNLVPMMQSAVRVVRVRERETNTIKSVELHAGRVSETVDFVSPQ